MSSEGKRVLVVDDDPDVRALIQRMLEEKRFRTSAAGDGAQALQVLKADPPDLVLLDLDMRGTDGWAFLEQVGRPPKPPVVFVSGNLGFEAFAKGARAGVAAFVAKPIRFKELVATCQRIVEAPAKPNPPEQTDLFENRRRAPRQQLLVRVDVRSKLGRSQAIGELRDLSIGGAQVLTALPLGVGDHVRFALDSAVTGETMQFDSEVRWCQVLPDGYAQGLELMDVTPDQAQLLYAVLGAGADDGAE